MALSEIEKLERRYAENPQGLTFAPLAEVHRKNGDVARALELLRPGLTLHPDYIPASIVLGRCHFDLGDLPAAETAFAHVLNLDGENVIALKALADISERLFRFDDAERWLRTLLAIDRSNDEARDQLGRVEAAHREAETASVADGPSDVAPPPTPEPPQVEVLAELADTGSPAAEEAVPLLEGLVAADAEAGPPPEGIQIDQPVTLEEPVQPLAGLVGRDDGADEPAAEPLALDEDFAFETAEDIVLESSGGSEFQVANASEELLTSRGLREPEPFLPEPRRVETEADSAAGEAASSEPPVEAAASEPAPFEPLAPEPPPAADVPTPVATKAEPASLEPEPVEAAPVPAAWAPPVAEPPRSTDLDLVLTESMAELLERQGHPGEALTIYRHLERKIESGPRIREKIAELERAATTPVPAYSVQVTHGQSVRDFLRGVLAARPPAAAAGAPMHAESSRAAAADAEGAPTRPAHDSLSLSSVFGEESTPTPPAVSAAGSAGAAPGGVSYDEFFGAQGRATAPRQPRAADSKSDDLDQFHAWLQNLKR
jgi:tetratricopeptide (TPR) repeat protein